MLEQLITLDKSLLVEINNNHSPFFDHFFWYVTNILIWLPAFATLIYSIIKTKKKDAIWIILGIGLTILIADQIASGLLKPLVERLRPTRDPSLEGMLHIVRGYTGGRFGFASSHAANSFGIALFTSLLFRYRWYTIGIFAWAVLFSYSRLYLGVHFPGDILCGMLIGLGAATFAFYLLKRFFPQTLAGKRFAQKELNAALITFVLIPLLLIPLYFML